MTNIVQTLTPEQISLALQQAQNIANTAAPVVQPNQFVFFAAFDGTNNDRDDLSQSGDPQMTNVAQLEDQVARATLGNSNVASRYYAGPGTNGALTASEWLSPLVTQQIINTANEAYSAFADQASRWLDANPGGSVTTMVTAFSRGGATTAVFSQLLYEKGLVDPRTGNVLIRPGEVGISAGLIYDPVDTGVNGNLAFAPNVENITVIRAANEYRYLFTAADLDQPGVTTLDFAGNHCDNGGCYDNGIGALTLQAGTEFFRSSGLTIADVPLSRQFDPTQSVVIRSEGVDELGNRLWDEYGSVEEGTVRSRQYVGSPASVQYLDDGTKVTTFIDASGRLITETQTVNVDGTVNRNLAVSVVPPNAAMDLKRSLATVGDALNLIKAIQTGRPLPITVSGLRLLSDFDPRNANLAGAASVGGGVLSLLSLDAALERGDTIGALTAGAQTVGFAASAFTSFTGQVTEVGNFLNGVPNAQGELVGGALPYFNLVNSIAQGDEVGVGVAALGIMGVPYIGQIYAIYSIISSLFGADEIPDPWGTGQFVWNGNSLGINAAGETGGYEAVSGFMNQVQATMDTLVAQVQSQNPGATLGLIANRMPTVGYDTSGFRYTNIDPLTGVETNPSLRYDTSGRPYNATPGSPESFQSMGEAYIRNALERGAIAPLWEVETAAAQTQAGDPNAGLTEEERAGRAGQLAPALIGSAQTWRPIALDLNGNGISTIAKAQSGVAFDVDDSGFLKQTDWINAQDAFLMLDRNVNGSVDASRELFSNGEVALNRRGVAGLAWTDSNYDGRIDANDPVFSQLELWRDINSDGAVDTGERTRLSTDGITSLNYAMGTFEQNGVTKQMASPDLQADTAGQRINVIPEGILIENTGGQISLLVTRVDDRTLVEANRDHVTALEDIEAIIDPSSLLTNDTFGGFLGRDLALTAVQNVRHGTAFIDANRFVHFQPEANYYGTDAGFDYAILAPNGNTAVATVDVTVQNINDAPSASAQPDAGRPIYGYTPMYTLDDGKTYGGEPIYEPFSEYDGRLDSYVFRDVPIAYEDPGTGRIVASDVDDPASSLQYEIVGNPQYGAVTIDSGGRYQYTDWSAPNTPSGPRQQGDEERTDSFQVSITDPQGASTTQTVNVTHYGPYTPPTPGGGGKKPIALDLDRNGFSFTSVDDSNVFFDVNGDGWKHKISWVKPGDGLLVYDANSNGIVDDPSEISFARYAPNAQSDLERLQTFDSNHDGVLSSADESWVRFGVWQDANSNGVVDAGELQTLDQRGVASLGLTSDEQFAVVDGNTIRGTAIVTMADGTTIDAADVTLAYSNEVRIPGTTNTAERSPFSPPGEEIIGTDANDLILGKTGNTIIRANAGDDVVFAGDGNDVIEPGAGNDVIYAGGGNDVVMPGSGNNVVYGGLGSDLILGGDGHNALLGEGGNDVIMSGSGNDLIDGGAGNDVLYAGGGDDTVSGGSGNDALFGADGNDSLTGSAGHDRLDGGAGNDLQDGGEGVDTMIGGAGDDIYSVNDSSDVVVENANEGTDTIRASISVTLGANVENLTLTGSDNLTATGNASDNILVANSGNATLIGAAGNDMLIEGSRASALIGGTGDDVYIVRNAGAAIVENTGEGSDTVYSSVGYALSENVENLILTGVLDLNASGNSGDNTLTGNSGDNILDGGAGADTLIGGAGHDTYVVDNAADAVVENPDQGIDTVLASVSHALSANVENLRLTGTAHIAATGNDLNNLVTGNAGNNVLDGGSGADTILGGAGDDTYIVDNSADIALEELNQGNDTVLAAVSYSLSENVENLTLTGSADTNATGNDIGNVLSGNSGSNVLDGGVGADSMLGGSGDDTYVVDNATDAVIENPDDGTDSVVASVSHALSANVENLALVGTADINATGNDLANTLQGNGGNNVLDGAAGADRMLGGRGDDTYVVEHTGDGVVEGNDEGTDTVLASVSFGLSANVENMTLTGSGDINATGNDLSNVLTGNSGNNAIDGAEGADVLIGGAGDDTYIVENGADAVVENANEGIDTVVSSVTYTLSDHVENLTLVGSANINATGNALNNTITGNNDSNIVDGGLGADTMIGAAGNDTYLVDDTADFVAENPGEGNDTVLASVNYALSDSVENLTLTGTADLGATGNSLDNTLVGNGGNNRLDGGAGADALNGGAGDDIYIVDNAADQVTENAAEGNDTVLASVSYALTANVEHLTLTGVADLAGVGNDLDNVIIGNSGNNVLDGSLGADTLRGGAGDDTYQVDNLADVVVEDVGAGSDSVFATVSYALSANVENLTLKGTANLAGTGNDLDNVIVGNSGNNLLDGGTGVDRLIGGQGDDIYFADDAADMAVENAAEGIDSVFASVSYVLPENVENLTITGTASDATGNSLDNLLIGNSGNNVLDGGIGADTMSGGQGDDTYIVDDTGDVVMESPNEGNDTVVASVSYALSANVENLTLTGNADLRGIGNGLHNTMIGNGGNNVLVGHGGDDTFAGAAGNDTLIGGSGNDTYIYNLDDGLDRIADVGGVNKVQLGAGLSLANVAIRLTTLDGRPYTVCANDNGRRDRDDDGDDDRDHSDARILTAHVRVLDSHGNEQPDQGMDFLVAVDDRGNILSPIQTFHFSDGSVDTFDDVLIKTRTLDARRVSGPVVTGRDDDVVYAGRNNTGVWTGTGNDVVYADRAGTTAYGEGGSDYLAGGRGSDMLDGGWGVDVIDGDDGNDVLNDPAGNSALLGDDGNDRISVGADNTFIAGGEDNDVIVTGAGSHVVAFNRGDGLDTIEAAAGAANTLSLGGGIQYSNLKFAQSGNDLILEVGRRDAVTFKDWYVDAANQSFVTLQVVNRGGSDEGENHRSRDPLRDQQIEEFDFGRLVAAFDQARAANPSLASWNLMNGMLDAHLGGSDTAALGGDMAYQYGIRGELSRLDIAAVQASLVDPQFGKEAQAVHSLR